MIQDRELTLKEKLYITASWMEAEGSFLLHKNCVEIASAQVEKAPLEMLQEWWGGTISFRPSRRKNQQDSWRWNLFGGKASGLSMTLYSLMMTKKRQAQIIRALTPWRNRKPDFIHRTHCPANHSYSGPNLRIDCYGHRHCRKCKFDQTRAHRARAVALQGGRSR